MVSVWVLFRLMDFLWPRWVFVFLWFGSIGAVAGIGALIAWLDADSGVRLRSYWTVGAVALGLAAAWGAYIFETVIDPSTASFDSREISQTAVIWAILLPNVAASVIGLVRQIRSGWL